MTLDAILAIAHHLIVFALVALLAVGVLPVSPVWLAAPVIAAALAGWTMVLDTRSRIARRPRISA